MCSTSRAEEFLEFRQGKRESKETDGVMVTENGLQLSKSHSIFTVEMDYRFSALSIVGNKGEQREKPVDALQAH